MRKVFLDTNILLEVILNRKQKFNCQRITKLIEKQNQGSNEDNIRKH